MRIRIAIPAVLMALVLLPLAPARADDEQPEKLQPHTDEQVDPATERFEKDFESDDMDKRLRILRWYGMYRHKDVLKTLQKIYLRERNLELQAAAAEGLGNQKHDPFKATRVLLKGLDKYEDYASREDPDKEEELTQSLEATVLAKSLESLAKLGVKLDKRGWKQVKDFIDHNHDDVAIAMLDWCGTVKEWRSLPIILEWFNFYPDGYSWAGGATRVDTGAAGNKDAKAAKAKWKAKYGGRARKARPNAHKAMKRALKAITGQDFEKPKELKAWMEENDDLLKRHGV